MRAQDLRSANAASLPMETPTQAPIERDGARIPPPSPESVESAVASYIALENACQTQLLAEAAGAIKPIGHAVAKHTSTQIKGNDPGAFGFRPLWERVLREQPDFLE